MTVKVSEEIARRVDRGELVPLVAVFYRPSTDNLVVVNLGAFSEAEAHAMLKAYSENFPGISNED